MYCDCTAYSSKTLCRVRPCYPDDGGTVLYAHSHSSLLITSYSFSNNDTVPFQPFHGPVVHALWLLPCLTLHCGVNPACVPGFSFLLDFIFFYSFTLNVKGTAGVQGRSNLLDYVHSQVYLGIGHVNLQLVIICIILPTTKLLSENRVGNARLTKWWVWV